MNELINSVNDILNMSDDFFDGAAGDAGTQMILSAIESADFKTMLHSQLIDLRQAGYTAEMAKAEMQNLYSQFEQSINAVEADPRSSAKKVDLIKRIYGIVLSAVDNAIANFSFTDVTIKVELIHPKAQMPKYAHDYDAGADVFAIQNDVIMPHTTMILPTGLKMAIPRRWMVSVRPRSGMSYKTALRLANAPGTIDAGYLQEVGIIATNTGETPITIHAGDRIAQFVVEKRYNVEFAECDDVTQESAINRENADGKAGFGSTGA